VRARTGGSARVKDARSGGARCINAMRRAIQSATKVASTFGAARRGRGSCRRRAAGETRHAFVFRRQATSDWIRRAIIFRFLSLFRSLARSFSLRATRRRGKGNYVYAMDSFVTSDSPREYGLCHLTADRAADVSRSLASPCIADMMIESAVPRGTIIAITPLATRLRRVH